MPYSPALAECCTIGPDAGREEEMPGGICPTFGENMDGLLQTTGTNPLPLDTLVVNMLVGVILSMVLAWFYTRYGRSYSNRAKLASTLPVLALTILLVISVVKSSLALSLGLVGALSIVRFRTAIKEPEELTYIFVAIAIGLGLGADQRMVTIVAFLIILAFLFVRTLASPRRRQSNLFLNISTPDQQASFAAINEVLTSHASAADLRRLDHANSTLSATYLVSCPDDSALSSLVDALKMRFPGSDLSFVEQDNTLGG
jgi:hypothetical protein